MQQKYPLTHAQTLKGFNWPLKMEKLTIEKYFKKSKIAFF